MPASATVMLELGVELPKYSGLLLPGVLGSERFPLTVIVGLLLAVNACTRRVSDPDVFCTVRFPATVKPADRL